MNIFLCILSVVLIGLEVSAVFPQPRYSGDGVLLDKRIYYFGGRISNKKGEELTINDLMYIDMSKSFNVSEFQDGWQGVQPSGDLQAEINYGYGMGVIPEENSIMIYGGQGRNEVGVFLENKVILYNATDNRWRSLRDPQEATLKQVYGGSCSRGDDHKAYVFGGQSWDSSIFPHFSTQMYIYDFTAGIWSPSTTLPANTPIRYNIPTTLVGKDLYYIGGQTAISNDTSVTEWDIMIPMKDILIFHIETGTWETKQANGAEIPAGRLSHTIASKPNSQEIVLYGGKARVSDTVPILDYCYVLDITSMTWTKKVVFGQGPGALYGHSAVFIDNTPLLFVMFGVNKDETVQSGFGVLDTETWEWSKEYTSPYASEEVNGGPDSDSSGGSDGSRGLSSGAIAGIVVGCVAGLALICAFVFIGKRRNRNGKNQESAADDELRDTIINNETAATSGRGNFKPEDMNSGIPNAALSPLIPRESAPAYRGHIPDEIDPSIALSVQNATNAQAAPRSQNLRPVKPDGE